MKSQRQCSVVNTSKYACRGRRSRSFSLHGTGSKIKCNIDYFFLSCELELHLKRLLWQYKSYWSRRSISLSAILHKKHFSMAKQNEICRQEHAAAAHYEPRQFYKAVSSLGFSSFLMSTTWKIQSNTIFHVVQ